MNAACALADELDVAITLTPDGSYYEDEAEAEKMLRRFYARFGFVGDPNGRTMTRPKGFGLAAEPGAVLGM